LVGLVDQARVLNSLATQLQAAAQASHTTDVQCLAQNMVDIIEGVHGAHYHPPGKPCMQRNLIATGDGYGLLSSSADSSSDPGYLEGAADHASLAANQADATDLIRMHAQHVQIAVSNIKQWVTTVDQDALDLVQHPHDLTHVPEIATLCDHAYIGVDTNGDEHVDPVAGEAGAVTAYLHGQLLAVLDLVGPST
jgi:hypothetical protein